MRNEQKIKAQLYTINKVTKINERVKERGREREEKNKNCDK